LGKLRNRNPRKLIVVVAGHELTIGTRILFHGREVEDVDNAYVTLTMKNW
jgi:hypothetical protein